MGSGMRHSPNRFAIYGGLLFVGLAFPASAYLAAGTSWQAGVGFWALIGGPGVMLASRGLGWARPDLLLAVLLAAVSLLGLDVTDSARGVVAASGYAFFGCTAMAALLVAGRLRRPTSHAPR